MQQRVAIRDPLPLVRSGLAVALADAAFAVDEPLNLVAWAEGGPERSVIMSPSRPDDWSLLDQLCRPPRPGAVVVLLDDPTPDGFRSVLHRGADSVAPRAAPGAEIVKVLEAALDHQVRLPIPMAAALTQAPVISDEARGWLRQLAAGTSCDELAWQSGYSRRTMYRRLHVLYRQLGAGDRTQALLAAKRRGLIE